MLKTIAIVLSLALIVTAMWFCFAVFGVHAQDDEHEGQPETCNNFKANEHPCACNQSKQCPKEGEDLREDKKCFVYCRKDKCRCLGPCTTHLRKKVSPEVAAE